MRQVQKCGQIGKNKQREKNRPHPQSIKLDGNIIRVKRLYLINLFLEHSKSVFFTTILRPLKIHSQSYQDFGRLLRNYFLVGVACPTPSYVTRNLQKISNNHRANEQARQVEAKRKKEQKKGENCKTNSTTAIHDRLRLNYGQFRLLITLLCRYRLPVTMIAERNTTIPSIIKEEPRFGRSRCVVIILMASWKTKNSLYSI